MEVIFDMPSSMKKKDKEALEKALRDKISKELEKETKDNV